MTTKKRGRPAFERSEDAARKVRNMVAVGVPVADVCKVIGISEPVLRRLYAQEIETAGIEATASVAGMLYEQCKQGNVTAQIFWMKTRGRWSEKHVLDHTSSDGSMAAGRSLNDFYKDLGTKDGKANV